jgi:hypothetical protein
MKDIEKVSPTNIPFKCPVCNGYGTVSSEKYQCHGCKGKGWVLTPSTNLEKILDILLDYEIFLGVGGNKNKLFMEMYKKVETLIENNGRI